MRISRLAEILRFIINNNCLRSLNSEKGWLFYLHRREGGYEGRLLNNRILLDIYFSSIKSLLKSYLSLRDEN